MVRVITQETFDDAVKENMEEFDMDRSEAVRDAKAQFEQQGVNLSNIVTSEKGSDEIVNALAKLQADKSTEEKLDGLKTIRECCKADLAQRVLATNNGAYSYLLRLASSSEDVRIRQATFQCLAAVMDTNPDHLEKQGVELMGEAIEKKDLQSEVLDWLLVCCVRHEENRQSVIHSSIPTSMHRIATEGSRDRLLRVCRVWMALVQDDDIRVPFGKAHDTAREIVESYQALTILTKALTNFAQDKELLCLILSTLASLSVRNEYCQEVVDGGGLQFVHDILMNHRAEADLVTRCLVLLKVLAGNDKVKSEIAKGGGIPLVMGAIEEHMLKAKTVSAGFQAVTAICLRQPDNCKQVMESDGASLITTAMSRHPNDRKVSAACAAAIRNIVSRDRTLGQPFIDLGVEELLNNALTKHGDVVGDTLKSALRDLDLKVELKEIWGKNNLHIEESHEQSNTS